MNTYGNKLRLSIFGESHGNFIGITIDGMSCGLKLTAVDFALSIRRRMRGDYPHLEFGVTKRQEENKPLFISGVFNDKTTGAPLTILFENTAAASADYTQFRAHPRPSHADFAADAKFNGFNDLRGGGHLSGRITLALVAAGVVAKKILDQKGLDIEIKARLKSILSETNPDKWEAIIKSAQQEEDSVGGELICITDGLPAGCGEPFFNSIESQIAHLAFSIPGVKAIAFGDFSDINSSAHIAASSLKGSAYNDMIADINGHTATNHSGGINGGISNGNPLVFSLDIRPPASISKVQNTMNFQTGQTEDLHITGRHDTCFALRCPVIAEAITYIVLADNLL